MNYLDIQKLRNLSLDDFLATRPYPYFNSAGMLTESGFQDLLANMPPLSMFEQRFGDERRAGQAPHDRYSLEYTPDMPVPKPWKEFIGELCSDAYRHEIERLLGARKAEFRFQRTDHAWHAVRAIKCPADRLRRVFIVVVNPDNLFWKLRDRIIGKRIQRF